MYCIIGEQELNCIYRALLQLPRFLKWRGQQAKQKRHTWKIVKISVRMRIIRWRKQIHGMYI